MAEVNEVLYPNNFDTIQNLPSVTEITSATGEDINAHRDAILVIERVLGKNPHIGRYTIDPTIATVGQRLDIIENGIAEGRFAFRNLNVYDVLKVTTDAAGLAQVDIGGTGFPNSRIAPVFIRGPLFIRDSGITNNETRIEVPFISSARQNVIQAGSIDGEPVLRITDTNANPLFSNRIALQIEGNVLISKGRLHADFAIEHSQLLGIDTTPRVGVNAIHVSRGDFHTHTRKRDPATGALLDEVDPNPSENNKGLIDHVDLLNIFTKTGQTGFTPVAGVAYHVTDGDGHDHKDGRGAPIDHNFLFNTDPSTSNHVTSGDKHSHSSRPGDGGAPIDHNFLLNIGFLSHSDIDRILNVDFRNHLELIDPTDASKIDPTKQGLGFHVSQGHVSDPNAHHTRYTDEEALSAQVLISALTTANYEEGRNTNTRAHIQAIGGGIVSASNPHGISAADLGALEGFDSQGNLPDFTRQFLETAITNILKEPSFDVLRGSDTSDLITGVWTFNNAGGIQIQENPSSLNVFNLTWADAHRLPDAVTHIDNNGDLPFVAAGPYHKAVKIKYDPAGTLIPLTALDVQSAINQLDAKIVTKQDQLSGSNQVQPGWIANAVTTSTIVDGDVTLAKLANQYSVVPFTFATQSLSATTTRRGIKIPNMTLGEILGVSVSWRQLSGISTSVDVDVKVSPGTGYGASSSVIGGSVNIVSYTQDSPTDQSTVGGPYIVDGDLSTVGSFNQIFCNIGQTGGGTIEVTVVVYCKLQHIV